jgi:phenylpropionate dioxygenase-like ring-hydroxylating dioxygenase large terminal subunit
MLIFISNVRINLDAHRAFLYHDCDTEKEPLMHVIANRWYAVLTSAELVADKPVAAKRMGQDVVFWRDATGTPHAALDACPHRGAALSPGRVVNGCIECPFHGFRFDGDGACTAIPAHPDRRIPKKMALNTWTVREAHGLIWTWTGPEAAPDAPLPFFDVLEGMVWDGSEDTVVVNTHYTRAIENQLDFAHLPFVHQKTIGRFMHAPPIDVITEVDGDLIHARTTKSDDDGIRFLGPNIWTLDTGPARQFLVFVPVDENTMRYYLRTYRRPTSSPLLNRLVGKFSRWTNGFIFREDTAVVESQPAEETRIGLDEVLVPSDRPIVEYRKWREQHRAPYGETPSPERRLKVVDADAA